MENSAADEAANAAAEEAATATALEAANIAMAAAVNVGVVADAGDTAVDAVAAGPATAGAAESFGATHATAAVDAFVCDICFQSVRFSANMIQHRLRYHAERVGSHRASTSGEAGFRASQSALAACHGTPASTTRNAAGRIGEGMEEDEHGLHDGNAGGAASADDAIGAPHVEGVSGLAFEGGNDETLSRRRQSATGTPALVHEYYRAFGDLERTQPVVPPERGSRPSLFVTDELRAMRMFALSAGGNGLSAKARADYYHTTVLAERAALRMQRAAALVVRAVVEGETPSDESSGDESHPIDRPDATTGGYHASDGPRTSTDPATGAPNTSARRRPARLKSRPKNNQQALKAALAMLVSTARPDDAAVFASLVSDDTDPDKATQGAPADPTPSTRGEVPGEGHAHRPGDGMDGCAVREGGAASNRTCKKKSSKRRRDIAALKEALDKLECMDGPVESAFPKASAFVSALNGEANRCLHEQQWRRTEIKSGSATYHFYSRDVMIVALDAFMKATSLCLRGKRRFAADNSILRTDSLNGDLYMTEQESVDNIHANKTHNGKLLPVFTLAIQLFSDATLVSWNNGMLISIHSAVFIEGVGPQTLLCAHHVVPDNFREQLHSGGGFLAAGSQFIFVSNLFVLPMYLYGPWPVLLFPVEQPTTRTLSGCGFPTS